MTSTPSLFRSLQIQLRVIGALLMREILTRYGRHNIGFLWLFLEPMLFTLGVTALWTATKSTHGVQLPIVAFAVTGYSTVLVWRNSANRCCTAITPNLALMYHRNVRVLDIFLARVALEIAGATISFIALCAVFIAAGWMDLPHDLLGLAASWALIAWFALALSLLIGAISERSEMVERLWHTTAYLLFPISGAVFMVDWLPARAQEIVLLIPMVHGAEMVRGSYFGPSVKAHYDIGYLVAWCLSLTLLGLALVRETGRRVIPE